MGRLTKEQSKEKAMVRLMEELTYFDQNVSDIGLVLATLGQDDPKALESLKDCTKDIDEFISLAARRADILLVVAAVRAATGYTYEEVEQTFRRVPRTGSHGEIEITEVPAERKVKTKIQKPNDALLKFLLVNRLPQYFSDSKKIEINKKTIEIKGTTEEEIRRFAGDLVKVIDSEFVEAEKSD